MPIIIPETSQNIDALFKNKKIPYNTPVENHYAVFQCGSQSASVILVDGEAHLLEKTKPVQGIAPKNLEQQWAMDALNDDSITAVTLTGKAGTGKTLLAMAAALDGVDRGLYDGILLVRPMVQIGQYDLGTLPGNVDEKYIPYLGGFLSNLEFLMPETLKKKQEGALQDLFSMYNITPAPLQLALGYSWHRKFVLADECQTLNHKDFAQLGKRPAAGTKLVIMGDLNQKHEEIMDRDTGLYKYLRSERNQKSLMTSHVNLTKIERSPLAQLFSDIFD